MKNVFFLFISLLFMVCINCSAGQPSINSLAPTDFSEKIKQTPGATIIDVRTPGEYSEGHLINSKNIDWNGNDFDSQVKSLDKTKPVFLYCQAGGRSEDAGKKMRSEGFKQVYELSGGIEEWRKAHLPETLNTTPH